MKTVILFCLLMTVLTGNRTHSAEILVVNAMPSYSHFVIPFRLAEELARRGHKVTCINSYPLRIKVQKIENYEDIAVVENIQLIEEEKKKFYDRAKMGPLKNLAFLFDLTAVVTNNTIHHKNVQKLLQSGKKFDLVIIENFLSEAYVGFGHHFKAPVIMISTHPPCAVNNFIVGNPTPLSYLPNMGGTLTKHMNFWQRLENFLMGTVFHAALFFYHLPQQNRILKSFVHDVELEDVLYNTSLMLTNSHVSVSNSVPLLPNIIEIAGLHIKPKALPQEMKKFLDEAKEGVVLFSMGSNLRSEDLKPETRAAILKAFSKIKQKVLWKFESDLAEAPENVYIVHWLPQQDVLSHPNVKVFITHGGRLSLTESIYYGVPLIGIPVFGDQPSNIAAAVEEGYALRITLDELTEEKLTQTLDEIITNPKYKETAQQRSKLMRDQPLTPLDSAAFWVEHVIRHKGAPHFRSAALDLKWYQKEMIDVYAFLLTIFSAIILITYVVLRKLWSCLFGKESVQKVTTTKTKKRQ